MANLLLGIDIGTSACKVALFEPDGAVLAQASGEYPVSYPRPGWAQQNPQDWWQAVCGAIRLVLKDAGADPAGVAGIGIDGQSWSAIPVDKNGKLLYDTPLWMDNRAEDVCREIRETVDETELFALCGNPLQPVYTLPKVLWYKKHLPDVYREADKILQANSYIAFCLTGAASQDLSQGYGYSCFDMRTGRWDYDMCERLGIRTELLPEIYPCHGVVGTVTSRAAAETGLTSGIPVVAGGLDAACGSLGAGVLQPGETQEQGGQAGGMSICIDQYLTDPSLIMSFHVAPGRWLIQGGSVGGGGICRWMERELGDVDRLSALQNGTNSFIELDRAAADIPAGSEGVVFLPYMAGERSPIWDSRAKGVYYGLDYAKTRGHLLRAGLEGVAYSLRHNLETARKAGADAEVLRAMGGAANSRLWTQIKADVTGKKIIVPASDTATTLGAVILAGVGVGVYKSFEEAVERTVELRREHTPNPDNKEVYDQGFRTYLGLYESLKGLMARQGGND